MFGIPKLYVILGIILALGAGVTWHEHKVSSLRDEILTEERARVAQATDKLQRDEAIKAADNAAQSEREASEHEEDMAAKDREVEAANLKIAELERVNSKCGFVSRDTVRNLNRGR